MDSDFGCLRLWPFWCFMGGDLDGLGILVI